MINGKIYYLPFKTRLSNAASVYHIPFIVSFIILIYLGTDTPITAYGILLMCQSPILLFSMYHLLIPIPLLKITEDSIYYSPRLSINRHRAVSFRSIFHSIFTLQFINVIIINDLQAFDKYRGTFIFRQHKDLIPHIGNPIKSTTTVYAGGKSLEETTELPLRFERFSDKERLELYNDLENHIHNEKK